MTAYSIWGINVPDMATTFGRHRWRRGHATAVNEHSQEHPQLKCEQFCFITTQLTGIRGTWQSSSAGGDWGHFQLTVTTPTQENPEMDQRPLYDCATTTDLLTQNLTVIVGNPSQRCFANAPWRAFTWLCAFLQEHNLQPWGTIREAVQESLETVEAVGLQQLPGLQTLWQHDLNRVMQVTSSTPTLWLATC